MRSHANEAFILSRDVAAVMVPSGDAIELKSGLSGFITQALGGSFTLYIEGNLYRLAGENADAIGKQVIAPPELPPGADDEAVRQLAWKQMRSCYDPEIPIDIVELGLVYECTVIPAENGGRVLAVTALGASIGDAREAAYAGVAAIGFEGMQHRTDIAASAII